MYCVSGIDLCLGVVVGEFEFDGDCFVLLVVNGWCELVELLVMGIGVVLEYVFVSEVGLLCENGIVVDVLMCSFDLDILVIGDCVVFDEFYSGCCLWFELV